MFGIHILILPLSWFVLIYTLYNRYIIDLRRLICQLSDQVAEIKRAVFRALTRLRAATIKVWHVGRLKGPAEADKLIMGITKWWLIPYHAITMGILYRILSWKIQSYPYRNYFKLLRPSEIFGRVRQVKARHLRFMRVDRDSLHDTTILQSGWTQSKRLSRYPVGSALIGVVRSAITILDS